MNYAGKFDAAITLDGQGSRSPAYGHVESFTAKAHGHVPEGAFVVPDANLIFHGEFKRAGIDLVLSHDGREFVVEDYFRGDKRAAIASPDGAHLTGEVVNALAGHVQVAQAGGVAAAAQVIGHVTKLVGSATAVRNGVSIILNNGDNVEKGDVVSTGADSTLGITFIDGTVFGLSSNARMVLNEMVYDPNGSSNSSLLSLVAGTITFVAGETAKHGDMKIDTPVATMGIRGTAVLTQINFVVPAGGGDPQPQASFQVLVEPNGTTGSYILFDKVTLLPIATVNQAGQMIQISGGNVSITNALMSPEIQKLITDVFALKFTDANTNTKLTTNFTDTITPTNDGLMIKTAAGYVAIPTFVNLNQQGGQPTPPGDKTTSGSRIPGPPEARSLDLSGNIKTAFALMEHVDTTGDVTPDQVSGRITFFDFNQGDRPTVKVNIAGAPNYVYKSAGQQDVTASLTDLQKQDIAATQIKINVVADPNNDNDGSAVWTYSIPDKMFDFLAAGETLTLTYIVRVDNNFEANNETTFIPITITITGTNDKPTVSTAGGTVIEKVGTGNTAIDTITGDVVFTDVDLTDRPIVSATLSSTQPFKYLDAQGHDITATLTAEQKAAIAAVEVPLTVVQAAGNANNGSATWTYSVPDHLFDFLADGETLVLNYVIQVDDGHGGIVSTPVTLSINGADVSVEGTNDVPTIIVTATTPTGQVTEDAAASLVAAGIITYNDPDLTDTHTASFVLKSSASSAHLPGFNDGTSQIGTFALTGVNENPGVSTVGSLGWSFTLDDTDPVLQSLAEGQTITQVYTVTVDDHHGGTVTQDVTVTITGTNDAPTITSDTAAAAGAVTEDDATPTLATGGTLAIQDLDLIDTHTATAVFKTSSSSAHLPGFTEGTTNIGTFTIDPTVTESNSDTSNGATLGWHFSLADNDPVLQSLAAGQTITQVYTVTFTDNHNATVTQDVTVTITGTNDAPTITSNSAAAAGAVTEDDATPTLVTGGTLAIQDLDLIDTHTATAVFKSSVSSAHLPGFTEGTTNIGTFTIDPAVTESNSDTDNGATLGWHFSLADNDPVLQSLAADQTITQVYTVTFKDNHNATVTQDVTVTITGTNDAPTVTSNSAAAAGAVTEDDATPTLATGGTLAIQDLDLIDTHTATAVFKSSSSSAHLPGFTEGATNIGTFTIDPTVTESNSDTSNGATLGWHFSLADNDPVLQSLAAGQTITQVYTVTFKDNHNATVTQDVTVTITGTNDAPTITSDTAAAAGAVTEDDATPTLATGGTLAIQDLDLIDTHTATAVFKSSSSSAHLPGFTEGATNIGTFTIDPTVTESNSDTSNGATLGWHFSLADNDPVLQSLAAGQTITQVYTVTFKDNHNATVTQDVTVTITGTNDAPTITSSEAAAKGAVTEDDSLTLMVAGTLAIQDLDLIDTHTATAVFKSSTSSASLPGFDGTELGAFTIDAAVTELATDTDNGATLGWHFSLGNSNAVLQSLALGQSITQVYTVTFTDSHNATVTQDVTVTINGVNDAPTITSSEAAAKGAVTEDDGATLTVAGTLAIQDLDLIDTHTATAVFKSSTSSASLPGFDDDTALGTFTIDPAVTELTTDTDNGATLGWHFSLDDNNPVLQSLALGQTITQVYTVTFTDNHNATVTQDVTVTINGANDAPTVTSDAAAASGAVTEESSSTLSADGTLAIRDLDLIDTHTATAVFKSSSVSSALPGFDGNSHIGQFTIDNAVTESASDTSNGATLGWHFTLDDADPVLQSLAEGQTITQVYTVTFRDNHDATVTQDVTVTITGTNDKPTLSGVDAGTLTDTAAADTFSTLTGNLSGTDVDNGETATLVYSAAGADSHGAVAGQYGTLTVHADGSYSYVPDADAINALSAGSYADTFTVQTEDVHGAVGTATITVNVTGANDAPVLSDGSIGALTDTAAADGFSDLTGQFAATDADSGETATITYAVLGADIHGTATGMYGALTVNADGSYSYVPDAAAINALPEGSYSDSFTIQVTDVHGASTTATYTVDLTGANDAPTISALNIGTLTDTPAADTFGNLTGYLTGTDADTGDTLTYAVLNADSHGTATGNYGTLTVNADGSYTYVPNATAINALSDGTYTDTFTVQTSDAHGASGTATLTVGLIGADEDAGPVIDTEQISIAQEGELVFIHGLSVVDGDAAVDETFVLAASAESGASVDPASTSDTLVSVNAALQEVTYTEPSASNSTTDKLTLTVTDGHGASDTVNLIFNLSEAGATFAGTTGKDVFFGTGDQYQDQFVFSANSNHDMILNFNSGEDHIDLSAVVTTADGQDWINQHVTHSGSDTLISINAHDTILLKNVAQVQASDFIFHA